MGRDSGQSRKATAAIPVSACQVPSEDWTSATRDLPGATIPALPPSDSREATIEALDGELMVHYASSLVWWFDPEFMESFAWDMDLLSGYKHTPSGS